MIYNDFKRYVRKTTLPLQEFANLIGYSPSSISNMKKSDYIPRHLAVLAVAIAELEKHDINIYDVLKKADMPKKASTREKKFNGERKYPKQKEFISDDNGLVTNASN